MRIKIQAALTYPDYQWSARDGWKFLGTLVVVGFIWRTVFFLMDRQLQHFYAWRAPGFVLDELIYFAVYLLLAVYFARTENRASFVHGFGLDRKPSDYVWFGIVMALLIRGFGHIVISHGLSKGVSHYDLISFHRTVGFERYFYLVPLLFFAPFFEEIIYRGFLYPAFRNSYPMWASMAIIVAWTANTHWNQYAASWSAAVGFSILTIVQCYLREKSGGIWDSILCHFTFNASTFFMRHM